MERAVVGRGRDRKAHRVPGRVGVDEKSIARGHKYESLVYDIDAGTVEFVCDNRGQESLEAYHRQFTREELSGVKAVAMDMWDPYITATKDYVPRANRKIVFDRFHVTRHVLDTVDKVRKTSTGSFVNLEKIRLEEPSICGSGARRIYRTGASKNLIRLKLKT